MKRRSMFLRFVLPLLFLATEATGAPEPGEAAPPGEAAVKAEAAPPGEEPVSGEAAPPAEGKAVEVVPPPATEADAQTPVLGETPDPVLTRAQAVLSGGNPEAALQELEAAGMAPTAESERARHLLSGECLERLERYTEAVEVYQRVLSGLPEGSAERGRIQARVDQLATRLGRVSLAVGVQGSGPLFEYEVWVDGRVVSRGGRQLYLKPGTRQVEVRAPGYEPSLQVVVVSPGANPPISIVLTPSAHHHDGLHPAYFWTGVGLTTATAATGAIFGLAALGARSGVDSAIAEGPPESLTVTEDDQARISNLALTADVFFVASGVLGVGTVILGLLTEFRPNQPDQEAPVVGALSLPGGAALTLRGSF